MGWEIAFDYKPGIYVYNKYTATYWEHKREDVCTFFKFLLGVCVFLQPGALAWNVDQLSSGSRDRLILQRDIRAPPLQSERRLQGHRQEVCGLKWSTDHQLLASGGNDNKVV